ncbi:MAG TPA: hypothetical protein VF244_10520 [Acidimicrobiales bacterium]
MTFCFANWTQRVTIGPYGSQDEAREGGLARAHLGDEFTVIRLPIQTGAGAPMEHGRATKNGLLVTAGS